jgi:hypothetical protein
MRLLVGTLVAVSACGASVDGDASTLRQAVRGGVADPHSTSVVWLLSEGPRPMACTGTIIAPDLVLTARHCVSDLSTVAGARCDDRKPWGPALRDAGLSVVLDEVVTGQSDFISGTPVLVGPDDAEQCGNDLALVRTVRPLGRAPVSLRLDTPPIVGEPVSVVGYGDATGPDTSGARLRRDGLRVVQVGRTTTGTGATRSTETEWLIDEGPCAGDSGGPAFDALGAQMGVMSRGNQATCQSMIYTRLDAFAGALRPFLPAMDAGVPEAPIPNAITVPFAGTQEGSRAMTCASSPEAVSVLLALVGWWSAGCARRRSSRHRAMTESVRPVARSFAGGSNVGEGTAPSVDTSVGSPSRNPASTSGRAEGPRRRSASVAPSTPSDNS